MDFGEIRERERDDVFSKAVKAGKRTYFFDVKETKHGEKYLTITESKRKFNGDDGSFTYEKHKIFLYKYAHFYYNSTDNTQTIRERRYDYAAI